MHVCHLDKNDHNGLFEFRRKKQINLCVCTPFTLVQIQICYELYIYRLK